MEINFRGQKIVLNKNTPNTRIINRSNTNVLMEIVEDCRDGADIDVFFLDSSKSLCTTIAIETLEEFKIRIRNHKIYELGMESEPKPSLFLLTGMHIDELRTFIDLLKISEGTNVYTLLITKEETPSEELENLYYSRIIISQDETVKVEDNSNREETMNEYVINILKDMKIESNCTFNKSELISKAKEEGISCPIATIERAIKYIRKSFYIGREEEGGTYQVLVDTQLW